MTAAAIATSPAAPPRWARIAATLTVLSTVPSGLWRVAMAVGVPVGVDGNTAASTTAFRDGGRRTSSVSPSCSWPSPCSLSASYGHGAKGSRSGCRSLAASPSHGWR